MQTDYFSISSMAAIGEIILTQFTVRPDEPAMCSREVAEATLRAKYPEYNLRFHYGDLEYGQRRCSSVEFGQSTVTANVADVAFGGAAFGSPKKVRILPVGEVFAVQCTVTDKCMDKRGNFTLGTERAEDLLIFDLERDARSHAIRCKYELAD
jgi:hypothetical protein